MPIYCLGSKDALLDEVLGAIATGVTVELDDLLGTDPHPGDELLAQLTSLLMADASEPAIQVWFEMVGLAARDEEPYLSNARLFANNWIGWIEAHLDESSEQDPVDLYAHLEGRLMLKMLQG
jgi:hypothetical protein